MRHKLVDNISIDSSTVIIWMNAIRESNDSVRFRLLENFWDSQLRSKSWLLNCIKMYFPTLSGRVYVCGGWYGVLSKLIVDNFATKVYSIDIDDRCVELGKLLCGYDEKIFFLTRDMAEFNSYVDPQLVINTSTEHITTHQYENWIDNVPMNTPVIIQGNNYYDCSDHIRCYDTLEEFNKNNYIGNIIFTDKIKCLKKDGYFYRFMTMGYKT